ncbi:osomolarity two-component system, sensor histidine kinase SLN1 [Talaromyces islandicus]|uniref:histidine kinase n=1 Tax=Talaromyces islandicus TaxID=28573 RepID=A0A0U1LT94_TALIS|nr:osomolarity two-component system, sensor histidine kinase SLN1 [Talaromyces islandicus]
MRIPIALQLALLVLVTSLVGLAVISIATWENNYRFVTGVKSQGLALTASLKAGQIASDLQLIEATCTTVATRLLIQNALKRFYAGNKTDANWTNAITDLDSALASRGYAALYQAVIYSRNAAGDSSGLLNVTSAAVSLGDPGLGFPPPLYPNITYTFADGVDPENATSNETTAKAFPDFSLNTSSVLVLGPLHVNASFSLLSFTLPIINNTSNTDILGYVTLVASASSLQSTLENRDYIDDTGLVLLLGPADTPNLFLGVSLPTEENEQDMNDTTLADSLARYVFLPPVIPGHADRHSQYRQSSTPFALDSYPEVLNMLAHPKSTSNHATSSLDTKNEEGYDVAVGVARPPTDLVDWVVAMEETQSQAFAPVVQLRKIVLACVFGTAGLIALVVCPLAHYCITPIRKLKSATEKAIQPMPQDPHGGTDSANHSQFANSHGVHPQIERVSGFFVALKNAIYERWRTPQDPDSEDGQRPFRVPLKVKESKHLITDELTELTSTFNEMSDELRVQYTRLEQRVAERTRELEISKRAAETANESKTLFIANISHELKTPLNGILGMCAVCMGEDDLSRIKKSLKVVYKSGDLLLNLLNDLLTFSKNEFEQAIRLDEKEFSLSDIKSQILTIFDKQVREGHVDFSVGFFGAPTADVLGRDNLSEKQPIVSISSPVGPPGTGRLKDMVLWGDHHRILQILINLVSNSLKFTPEGGKVEVRIRCLGDYEMPRGDNSAKASFESRRGFGFREQTPYFWSRDTEPTLPSDHSNNRGREPAVNYRILEFSFEVEDTGPGIPAHLQQKVFDPFMQGDLGLNRKYGGTGLGLSICSQLSRLMRGTISLESTVGSGTTFTVRIPLKFVKEMAPSTRSSSTAGSRPQSHVILSDDSNSRPATDNSLSVKPVETKEPQPRLVGRSQPFFAAAPPSSQAQAQSPSATPVSAEFQGLNTTGTGTSPSEKSSRIRVLVAEDNAVNQEVVLRMLKLEDIYDVTVAKDGQEAYDIVKAAMSAGKNFDLILMDIQMPNVDGLQCTRLIREIGYSAPIVALSALTEEYNIKDCMDSGMNMFLPKPIRRPALKQMLKKFATIEEEDGD